MKKIILFQLSFLFAFTISANNKLPQVGLASYYGDGMNHHRVACGERYCKDSFSAAHRTLPFGTYLRVTNLGNHKTVVVRINDRGPHRRHRIIDVSGAAADMLDIKRCGLAKVKIELATADEYKNQPARPSDSLSKDSLITRKCIPVLADADDGEKYIVQGGAYNLLKYALTIKNYLESNGVTGVIIKHKKGRRRAIYKVMIGPMDCIEKDKALKVLKNRGISGLVIRT